MREANVRYKTSSVIIILIFMTMGCISYVFQGLFKGTILFLVMLVLSTATHNCYRVDFYKSNIVINKFYGKNIQCDTQIIRMIQLDSSIEEIRILGQTRYIHIEKTNGEYEKHNIEPVASKKFENILSQFCELHDIPFILENNIPVTTVFHDKE